MAPVYSTVVDRTPKLVWEAFVFCRALVEIAAVDPDSIVIHATPSLEEDVLTAIAGPCRTGRVPFGPSPFANKIAQCASPQLRSAPTVLLCDADLVWLEPFMGEIHGIAGVPVFGPTPDWSTLSAIFSRRGLRPSPIPGRDPSGRLFTTDRNNLNGGLYVVSAELLASFGTAWRVECERLLREDGALCGAKRTYGDQIGAAIGIEHLGLKAQHLDRRWNAPPSLAVREPVGALHDFAKFEQQWRDETGRLYVNASPHASALTDIMRQANESRIGQPFAIYRQFRYALYAGNWQRAQRLIEHFRAAPLRFPNWCADMAIHLSAFRRQWTGAP